MSPNPHGICVGDVIEYRPFGSTPRRVVVTALYAEIKNGKPGFDGIASGVDGDDNSYWGYTNQITAVISRAADTMPKSIAKFLTFMNGA